MIKKIINNAVFKNASWIIFGKVAQMVVSLIVGILTARYLGPSNYGIINYAAAYVAFFMTFCTLGINSILVKEIIENPKKEGEIIGSTLFLRAISSILSALMIVLIVYVVDADEKTTIAVTAVSSVGLVFHILDTFNYWFQAKLNSKVTAMTTLIAYVITSGYKVILLILGKGVVWFAFATSLDYVCLGMLSFIAYKRNQGQSLSVSKERARKLLKQSYHFILPSLMVSIYGYTDKFMLKQMLGESEVGFYAIATAICSMWCFILNAIIDSMYPGIMESYQVSEKEFEKQNKRLYAIVFYLSVFVSMFLTVFSELIVKILYGVEFLPASVPLRIVTWYTAFSYLGVARNAWIICEKQQHYLKHIYIASAVLNIILNTLLIPQFGVSGAAWASLVTQISTIFVVPLLIKGLRKNTILLLESIMLKGIF